jgi:hypothetical protein
MFINILLPTATRRCIGKQRVATPQKVGRYFGKRQVVTPQFTEISELLLPGTLINSKSRLLAPLETGDSYHHWIVK